MPSEIVLRSCLQNRSFGEMMKTESFISVDIEASGPIPGEYSMLSVGACLVFATEARFSCELKPINGKFDPNALKVTGYSLEHFEERGLDPAAAMQTFKNWIMSVTEVGSVPVFVGFNAPFDWSFINYYFHRFLGGNPFGFTALDIKAFYMGQHKTSWAETKSSAIAKVLNVEQAGDHNPLHDAIYQAEILKHLMSK